MDRRFLTVLAISLVFALLVSAAFYQLARAGHSRTTSKEEMKDIVLAARAMNVGISIKASDVHLAKIPASAFPHGAFSRIEDVVDRPVVSNILAEEPVLSGRLAPKGSGFGLAPVIPVGMRAVTVRVNDVVGVAGFVLPGMRVDVLVTGHPPQSASMITTTCLQNILVLSAGTTMQPDSAGKAMPAPTVTLLVDPSQAEILTLASSDGRIQLVLRNPGDHLIEKTPGTEITQLYGLRGTPSAPAPARDAHPVIRRVSAPAVMKAPPPDEIVVFRGNKRSVEVLSGARTENN
jgi:pilus assembly protein CpaB